jgi:hypothetical protein
VDNGQIRLIPGTRTLEQLNENLMICTPSEMVDRLGLYQDLGIDDFIMNVNVGVPQEERLEAIERFASDVMPWFSGKAATAHPAAAE